AAQAVEDVFHLVGRLGDLREAEARRVALERVGDTKQRLQRVAAARARFERHERLLHRGQALLRFLEEQPEQRVAVDVDRAHGVYPISEKARSARPGSGCGLQSTLEAPSAQASSSTSEEM